MHAPNMTRRNVIAATAATAAAGILATAATPATAAPAPVVDVDPGPDPDAELHAACDRHAELWRARLEAVRWAADLGGHAVERDTEDGYGDLIAEQEAAILAHRPRTARGLVRLLDTLFPDWWEAARDHVGAAEDAAPDVDRGAAVVVMRFLADLAAAQGAPLAPYDPPAWQRGTAGT